MLRPTRPIELFRVDCEGPDLPRMGFALHLHEAIQLAAEMHYVFLREDGAQVPTNAPTITRIEAVEFHDIEPVRWLS